MNQNESIEKLLAGVQLRQPELDVETLLRKAAESEGSVTRREQLTRVRRKRCFCRWATLSGIWASGLAIGVLVMYLYTNNSLREVRDEMQTMRAKLAMQSRDADQPSPSIAKKPAEPQTESEPDTFCRQDPAFYTSGPNQLLDRLLGPEGYDDQPLYAMLHVVSAKRNPYYTIYSQPRHDRPEPATKQETRPYKPSSPKTQQQLFRELLRQVS